MISPGSRPLRIAHCMWGGGGRGGVDRMDAMLARHGDRSRYDFRFIYLADPHPDDGYYFECTEFLYTGAQNRFAALVALLRDIDIVQYQGGFNPLVAHAARAAEVPVILEIMHNVEAGQIHPFITRSLCVSHAVTVLQPDQGKCVTLYNGVEPDDFPFTPHDDTRERIVILVPKQMTLPFGDVASALLAVDDRIVIHVVGSALETEVVASARVKNFGPVTDMPRFYAEADFMMLLTPTEAFGLVALEAMASGCVPLVSNIGALPEVVTDGVDGFTLAPYDIAAIRGSVARAIGCRDRGDLPPLRAAGRRKVEERFSGAASVARYEALYADLVAQYGGRPTHYTGPVSAPPLAVNLDEALFALNHEWWDTFLTQVTTAGSQAENFGHPRLLSLAFWLGFMAESRKRGDLAAPLCAKGFDEMRRESIDAEKVRELFWTERSRTLFDDHLQAHAMTRAEAGLNCGAITDAIGWLQWGCVALPAHKELSATLELLRTKIR